MQTTLKQPAKVTSLAWIICALGAIFYCYEYFLRITPSMMIPQLQRSFMIHADGIALLMAFYYYAYTPMQLVVGVVTDLFGARKILTTAVALCVIGNFLFGFTHSLAIASLGRFLIGFGSAFAFVGALKLASIWLPATRFAMFAGVVTALGMAGAAVGDNVVAYMVQHIGWRETIYIATVFGVILTLVIWFVVRNHPSRAESKLRGKEALQRGLLGIGKVVRSQQIWLAGMIGCILFLSLTVFGEAWGAEFHQRLHPQFTHSQAAFANSIIFIGWLIGSPLVGWISDTIRRRRIMITIGSLGACLTFSILVYTDNLSAFMIYTLVFFTGMFCSVQVLVFALGRENMPRHFTATAVAFINLLVMIGGIFGTFIGLLLDYNWSGLIRDSIRVYTLHDFRMTFLFVPVAFLLGAILSFFIKETHAKEYEHPHQMVRHSDVKG